MFTKAIVEQVIDEYSAKVHIPLWDRAYGTSDATTLENLPVATICANTGIKPVLSPGEIVYIECENYEKEEPVILGTLIREDMGSSADINARSLTVEVDCHFPQQFWDQIDDFIRPRIAELQTQIDRCLNPEKIPNIYGVEWDYSKSATSLTRLSVSSDPNHLVTSLPSWEPVAAIGTGDGASPFDDIAPWKDMTKYKYNDEEIYVKLPEYWYKYDLDSVNSKLRIYISDAAADGFIRDERSNYYVARYTCDENYKSITNKAPKVSESRKSFRTKIENRDTTNHTFFQYDFATIQSLWRLYIVEFADWNSQKMIGSGASALADSLSSGRTDNMSYHTGTSGTARNDNTAAIQYRWIENPFGNVAQFVDGVNFLNRRCYYCIYPAQFTDGLSINYIDSLCTLPNSGYIKQLQVSSDKHFLIPSVSGGSTSTYIPDYVTSNTGEKALNIGGDTSGGNRNGFFKLDANNDADYTHSRISTRACIKSTNNSLIPIKDKGTIPIASDTEIGGIRVGTNLSIDPTTGVLSAVGSAQIQSDWNQTNTSAVDYIKNKPVINGNVLSNTTAGWNSQPSLISTLNTIYVYTDHHTEIDTHGNTINIPGVKIGDGQAYLIDMPFTDMEVTQHIEDTSIHVSSAEKEFWNNKVSMYQSQANPENLIFTTN